MSTTLVHYLARYVGDNFCDDENNFEACDYDGGDCCLEHKYELDDDEKNDLKTVWNRFCEECQCIDPGTFQKYHFCQVLSKNPYFQLTKLATMNQ